MRDGEINAKAAADRLNREAKLTREKVLPLDDDDDDKRYITMDDI